MVAAAVMRPDGAVLLARRPEHVHQGGKWEFPGGKVEAGESFEAALTRELREELDIEPLSARRLIRIRHDYPDRSVLLDVWRVDRYTGEPHGREGQPLRWVPPQELDGLEFPEANRAIVTAVQLPETYLITPEPTEGVDLFLHRLEACLAAGTRLVQFRAKSLERSAYRALAEAVIERCHVYQAKVLLNADPAWCEGLEADGLHLDSARLAACASREGLPGRWLAASCHDAAELARAQALGVDFAVLGPVAATRSHPRARPLGWRRFAALCESAAFPVYALGGMTVDDLPRAQAAGGQGIAAIRGLWEVA